MGLNMIKPIFTLAEKYKNTDIYIHEINRTSIGVFSILFYKGIDVAGFATIKNEFVGKLFMNRKIINTLTDIPQNSIIVCSKYEKIENTNKDCEYVSYDKLFDINSELRYYNIILYGYGNIGKKYLKLFQNHNIDVDKFCASTCDVNECMGKKVESISTIRFSEKHAFVIAVGDENYKEEMLCHLEERNITSVYCEDIVSDVNAMNIIFLQSVSRAIDNQKQICILGQKIIAEYFRELLEIYNVKNIRITNEEELVKLSGNDRENGIHNSYYIIASISRENVTKKAIFLESELGLRLEEFLFSAPVVYIRPYYLPRRVSDLHFGFTNLYDQTHPGFFTHKSENELGKTILILGNSTSEEGFQRISSWVNLLFSKLQKNENKIVVLNGCHAGSNSCMNLIRFIRDGYYLQPHLVISFSGIQDLYDKVFYCCDSIKNRFNTRANTSLESKFPGYSFCHGIQQNNPFEDWKRDEKCIHEIAKIYGAECITILQPMNMGKNTDDLFEYTVFHDDIFESGATQFRENAKEDDFYINWLTLFDDEPNMYIDTYHYSQRGHEIIADKVYELLKQTDLGVI